MRERCTSGSMLFEIPAGRFGVSLLAVALALSSASPIRGQAAIDQEWNSARALELVARAQQRRAELRVDTAMLNYRADARGYVYFLLDHAESARQSLVRTDQVAVDVFWRAPNEVRQRIVGLRERKELPVSRLHYYLDRLTVVQDNFGDGIVIADGENVRDVPHPVAPNSATVYDFRLADSLALRLAGSPEPIRVYELNVRPKDSSRPAAIGSVFVDAASGSLVKLELTFTAAAYTDRRLDHINVVLENGLWRGRFWLPHEQQLEIRREMPELDFPVGTIIRTRMRIGNYRFNQELDPWVFFGPRVTAAPREEREAFAFEQEIDAERRLEGIGRPLQMAELRQEARVFVRRQPLSGLPRSRLHLAGASDLFRYNRAEGVAVGIGASITPAAALSMRVRGGWAFGPDLPQARIEIEPRIGVFQPGLTLFLHEPRDVGDQPAASGSVNTLSALIAGRDYFDLFTASGGKLALREPITPGTAAEAGLRVERHRSLDLSTTRSLLPSHGFRPVLPVDDGALFGGWLAVRRISLQGADRAWQLEARADLGRLRSGGERFTFLRPKVRLELEQQWGWRESALTLDGTAGLVIGEIPRQSLFLIGGRGTVAGHPFRQHGGDTFATLRGMYSVDLHRPWLRGHLFAEAGYASVHGAGARAAELWGVGPTDRIIGGVGGGIGVFYDLLRLHTARGVGPDGRWEVWVEARRGFWEWL
jgi:hypothetical protein